MSEGALISEAQVAARWPTLYDWTRGLPVDARKLGEELKDALRYLGFAAWGES